MTRYSAEELERQFRNAGRARQGNKKFANDAGYWSGGACDWGGCHNLKNDCETLAKAFNQMENLREIKKDLQKCTSSQEYEAKKSNYIRKCEGIIDGLKTKTNSNSSIFNVCIIWQDEAMDKHVISKLSVCQESLNSLKEDLQRETYKWVQEIKSLRLEQKQVEKRMQENKKKAMDKNIDPAEKALLLQLIEEDGTKLKSNLEKQKSLDQKFNYDPSQHVMDLVNKMKEAIERKGNNPTSSNPRKSRNATDPNNSDSEDDTTSEEEKTAPNNDNNQDDYQPTNWWEENKELVILGSITSLIVFYFYYQEQSKEQESNYYYDY